MTQNKAGKRKNEKWPTLRWDQVVDRASKCVFHIRAGRSAGTAFLVALARNEKGGSYATLATAWHVVEGLPGSADDLELASATGEQVCDSAVDAIGFYPLGDPRHDTALIVCATPTPLVQEKDLLPLFPYDSRLAQGAEIGWLGFPGITEPELCFFSGHISGYLNDPASYLVGGVAVNGVSGGPALDDRAHVIGLVSSYIPNRINANTTLPGLTVLVPINAVRYWMEHRLRARVLTRAEIRFGRSNSLRE